MNQKADILLDRLADITSSISSLLDDSPGFDLSGISQIDTLYAERKIIIDDVSAFIQSRDGKNYLSAHSEDWNQRLSSILSADKINLDRIARILKEKENGLRAIRSQKSLLIYSKEESHGY